MTATTTTTLNSINLTMNRGEYQPLRTYIFRRHTNDRTGGRTADEVAANKMAHQEVACLLVEAGFSQDDSNSGQWWGHDCEAHIVVGHNEQTIGVELIRTKSATYHCHVINGTYDALSPAEKFNLSGRSGTVED